MSKSSTNDTKINRADYKAIKHMDREKLSEYLNKVWRRGFEKGYQAAMEANKSSAADNDTAQSAMAPAT